MDIELLQTITQLASTLSVQAVLLYWVSVERRRADRAWDAIEEDWQRQREREISRSDAKNGGSGL